MLWRTWQATLENFTGYTFMGDNLVAVPKCFKTAFFWNNLPFPNFVLGSNLPLTNIPRG